MSDSESVVLRSHANPTIRRLVRLRDNRTRRREKCLLVDGWRETRQAIEGGLELRGLYLSESTYSAQEFTDIQSFVLQRAKASQSLQMVSEGVMERIAYGNSARGVVAEFREPALSLARLSLCKNPLVLVLDRLEKPGNIGAVFRCADAAGVDAVLLCEGGDLYNPNTIRSSLGTVFKLPAAVGTELEIGGWLEDHGLRPVAARVESSDELWSSDLSGPLAIIMGNEAEGLGERWSNVGGKPVSGIRIPMWGAVDSLNVSVSAAVLLFEARRQRQNLNKN